MRSAYDAVVVGSGPNGLAAAIALARAGHSVLVLEANDTIGGGCRSSSVTLPGFVHDICAAIHPMAFVSPVFRELPLATHGVEWVHPPAALAHPFEDGTAAVLHGDFAATGDTIAPDAAAWTRLIQPFVENAESLVRELLKPIRVPSNPFLMARFGVIGVQSCARVARRWFTGTKARALFAGCAAHSVLAMDAPASASFGLVLAAMGHVTRWPLIRGGSQALVTGLVKHLHSLGGESVTNHRVRRLLDLPPHRAVLFDLPPRAVEQIAGSELPQRYRATLRSFRHGPGVFKIDWALSGPIPWKANECTSAATVHLGASFEEIAASEDAAVNGRASTRPFVLVAQQSLFDDTRAPRGCHTAWAYCHVPHGWASDMTEVIEAQIERFAPGFRDVILARHTTSPSQLASYNSNMIGGDIAGGANDLAQLLFRPSMRWDPYSTPNPRLFICSSSTPPGGGVHGMCGYGAARSALRSFRRAAI